MTDHHLLEVCRIELFWLIVANAVILGEITLKGLVVAHLVGDDATVAQHTTLVHRVLEHLLRQAVKTCHRLGGTLKTKRLRYREVGIEYRHRVLLDIDALQGASEVLLTHLRLVATVIEKAQ